jgi:hypothetical protein
MNYQLPSPKLPPPRAEEECVRGGPIHVSREARREVRVPAVSPVVPPPLPLDFRPGASAGAGAWAATDKGGHLLPRHAAATELYAPHAVVG